MTPPKTSSTSSSESSSPSPWLVVSWTVVLLVGADVGLGVAFPYPVDPDQDRPNAIQTLLEYGRSTSGTHHRMLRMQNPPFRISGNWIGALRLDESGTTAPPIAFFGNSFLGRTADGVRELLPDARLTRCIGTYSPPSQALGAYRRSRADLEADVVVMGILASTWPLSRSFMNASFSFSNPEAYTYPVYSVGPDGSVIEHSPVITTREELARAFTDPTLGARWKEQLARFDERYMPILYDETLLDESVLVRLTRRAVAGSIRRRIEASYEGPSTFDPLWRAIVAEFAVLVRSDNRIPVVILYHDFGFGDDLYTALRPTLDEEDILRVSSSDLFSANDASNFGEDHHFTRGLDAVVAAELLRVIGEASPD